jgi:hypothetical protein
MFFQKVLKGICGIDDKEATEILHLKGIMCSWWRSVREISPEQIANMLTEHNLDWHLNRYETLDPRTGKPFGENTPFISTTSGVVERDAVSGRNITFTALETALRFATDSYTRDGYVFYGYVYTLGKQALKTSGVRRGSPRAEHLSKLPAQPP